MLFYVVEKLSGSKPGESRNGPAEPEKTA